MFDLTSIFADMYGDFALFIGMMITLHLFGYFIKKLTEAAHDKKMDAYGRKLTAQEKRFVERYSKNRELYQYAQYYARRKR